MDLESTINPIKNRLLIYGAGGYTGQLMVREAMQSGISPIIAGRQNKRLETLAAELSLETRVFTINEAELNLNDVKVLLNCAGPFSATAETLAKACLNQGIHYLDITGEIAVFQTLHQMHALAQEKGIILLPGVGFDIVPTDCLAAMLKDKLSDAHTINLAFSFATLPSVGTAITSVEAMGKGGFIRENHQLKAVKNGHVFRQIPFATGKEWAVSIPWGDVYTSGVSTGVANGLVYTALPKAIIYIMKASNPIKKLFDTSIVQKILKGLVRKILKHGPDDNARNNQRCQFWGEAINANKTIEMTLSAPNVYTLTVLAGIKIAKYCLNYQGQGGYYTPSTLLGKDFIKEIPEINATVIRE